MNKLRKEYLLKLINKEVAKAELAAQATAEAARQLKNASPYQAGDRYRSESSAQVARQYLERLKALRDEIVASPDKIYSKVKPVSFVELVYENGENAEFYYVKNVALLPGIMVISKNSPIGLAIFGKKQWDSFTYEVDSGGEKKSFSGRIIHIE